MRNTKKKRCEFCHRWFLPDPRAWLQYCCSDEICQKKRKIRNNKSWLQNHPDYIERKKKKFREWLKRHPFYCKLWRAAHPKYRQRQKKRKRLKRIHLKSVAKPNSIAHNTVYKLTDRSIPQPIKNVAKPNSVGFFPTDEFTNTLQFIQESVAKLNLMARRTNGNNLPPS